MRSAGYLAATTALTALVGLSTAKAADVTFNFDAGQPAGVTIGGNNDQMFPTAGGNSGGFMAVTYPVNGQTGIVVFDNTDPGKVVTGFSFSCDLRVGNSTGDRAADGFSISFARDGDAFLSSLADSDLAGNCCAETGTKTGIAVSFDTWSGNSFPTDPNDTTDIEGIIVRVDNVTVKKVGLPTRHGTADDITSLQTGPRDAAYWADGGDPYDPAAWATLAWRPFAIDLTSEGKLSVTWKGNKILDGEQTTFFPSAGQLVFAGRTGGANEHTHVDNLHLVTTAQTVSAVPGAPPNLTAAQVGSRRVQLTWGAAVVAGDPNARVAYEVERNGVVVAPLLTTLTYDDRGLAPGTSYTYKVRGKNIAGLAGADSTTTAKTGADIAGVAFTKNEVWFNIPGTDVDSGIFDPHYSDPPDTIKYGNGYSYGETSGFGNTYGDNFVSKMTGMVTVPETGSYRFFVRSDDASALYVKVGSIPEPTAESSIAVESGCCGAFEDVAPDGTVPEVTSEPIALTAGQKIGITFVVKEGGGGDWGQVAWRKEGNTTPAAQLTPIRGSIIESPVDGVGATIAITQSPADTAVSENSPVTFTAAATGSSPYGADYGNAISWQWYVNNTPVLNANGSSYTIPVVAIGQNNAKVKVVAAVAGASATSTEATLAVSADTAPPTVTAVTGSGTFNSVTLTWSEPVKDPTAIDASKYQIAGLTLSAGTRINDRTVSFTTSTQAENTVYPVVANGVLDNANNASAFTGSFTSYQFKAGLVSYKTFQGETGGFDTWTTGEPPVMDKAPTTSETRTEYVANTGDVYDNYFGQLTGYFIPPSTGDYVFYIAADDHAEMYLSTDTNPANKKKIGEEPAWGARREWIGDGAANNSATRGEPGSRLNISNEYPDTEWATGAGGKITLQGGQRYYLEVLFKEGGGGDHGSATYKLATGPDPANGVSALTGAVVGTFVDPQTLAPIITQRPSAVSFTAGETVTFSVAVDSAAAVTYQWYQNKKAIAGATGATLTIPNAGVGAVGDYYVTVTSKNGTASSYPDDNVRATLKGAFVIEAEDYNYDSGKTVAAASVMPLGADLYQGKDGIPDVDYRSTSVSGSGDDGAGNSYRNGWVDGSGTVFPSPAGTGGNLDVIIDNGGGNQTRPDFNLVNNYKIGWGGTGNWFNYTRTFAAGKYSAVFVGSRDGRSAAAMGRTLELVTGDITKIDQTTTVLGELTTDGTGAWSSNDNVPFLTPGASTVAEFDLNGTQTLRLRISSGDGDNDALLLYKLGNVAAAPVITGMTLNADGTITITWTGGGVIEASPTLGGTYTPVAGSSSPFTFTPTDAMLFGRVRN